jgi:peptidoglycan/LPS O-acetylase OafA/YrhL
MYILQAPILWVFWLRDEWSESTNVAFAFGFRAAEIAAVVALAIASHRYLETPTREWIRAKGRRAWSRLGVSPAK